MGSNGKKQRNKETKGFTIASIISLVVSGLGIISLLMIVVMFFYSGSGRSATSITNEAVIGILGIMVYLAGSWIFGLIGTVMGIIVMIIGLAKKYYNMIWMPILSAVLGIVPLIGPVLLLISISV